MKLTLALTVKKPRKLMGEKIPKGILTNFRKQTISYTVKKEKKKLLTWKH